MAMKDGKIMLIEVDNTQMAIIKSWNSMKYDRRKNMMIGDCSKELLDNRCKNRLKMFPLKKVGTRVGTRVGTQETQQPRGF